MRSAAGAFTLSGVLPYKVHVSGRARAADLAEMPIDLRGTLGKDGITFDPAQIGIFGGQATLSGSVVWSPVQTWSISGRATGINTGLLRADLPGEVSFTLDASGRGFDAKGDLTAAFSSLSGKLRGVAASGAGTVTHSRTSWGFNSVRVALGSASLALDGHIDDRMDLRFAVSASDLSLLAPDARGKLKASGTVNGTLADPTIVATAHGGDFEYQGIKLEAFDADVNFNPGAPQQESKIDAHLHKLTYKSRTLDSVALTLSGPPAAYDVHLSASATGLAVAAEAKGPYAHGVFTGQLSALTIGGSEQLHLSLERPVDLSVSLAHARVEWMCLLGQPGSMCADGEWTPTAWSTTVMTNQLPLKLFWWQAPDGSRVSRAP